MAIKKTAKVEKDSYEVLTTVAEAIARLRWDNHDVIQQYDLMTNQIEQIEYEARQEHAISLPVAFSGEQSIKSMTY